MKRDWDMVRAILLEVQNMTPVERDKASYELPHLSDDPEAIHAFMLYDAGFLKGIKGDADGGRSLLDPELTWAGQDLLASIESKPVWERVKHIATEKGLEMSFDQVKLLAIKATAQILNMVSQ